MAYPVAKLGSILTHRKEFTTLHDTDTYKRARVQLHARGIVVRDHVEGSQVRTKKQQVAKAGELLVAEIDAKLGGFGIVPPEVDGAIVSSHYFLFEIDVSKCLRGWLDAYMRSDALEEQVAARGSTNYAAIRPRHVLEFEIPLPPLPEQRRIVKRISAIWSLLRQIQEIRNSQARLKNSALLAAYKRIATNASFEPMRKVAPLDRRPVEIRVHTEYPQVAVRSFGRGTFRKPSLNGADLTWQKLFRVRQGDILISNIKAWEGAIAMAGPEDDGRVASHRYLTCVPIEGKSVAEFVCFHLLTTEGLDAVGMASPGSADRNRTLGMKALEAIPVPVPAFDKQLRFRNLIRLFDEASSLEKSVEGQVEELKRGVLAQAFEQVA